MIRYLPSTLLMIASAIDVSMAISGAVSEWRSAAMWGALAVINLIAALVMLPDEERP